MTIDVHNKENYNFKPLLYVAALLCFILIGTSKLAYAQNIILSSRFLYLGDVSVGNSVGASINYSLPSGIQDYTIITEPPYLLSTDSVSFATSVTVPANATGTNLVLYVKLQPIQNNIVSRARIRFVRAVTSDTNSLAVYLLGSSYSTDTFYKVLSWNVLWYGDNNCNCNIAGQRKTVEYVLKQLKPEVCALQEVVSASGFSSLAQSLGTNYQSMLSPFCSFALNTSDGNWPDGQKLAYIIDTNKFKVLPAYGFAINNTNNTSSTSEYWAFSSGRLPYVVPLVETGTTDTTWFFNLHAKANSDLASYNRRENGAYFLADSMNTYYKGKKAILVGDYNDFLEGSITTGYNTPYEYLLDTAMFGISLPSLYPDGNSYVYSNGLIDNFCANADAYAMYAQNSFIVLEELYDAINDYTNNGSDHYPIVAFFRKSKYIPVSVGSNAYQVKSPWHVSTSGNSFSIKPMLDLYEPIQVECYAMDGSIVLKEVINPVNNAFSVSHSLSAGMYILRVRSGAHITTQLIKL